MAQIPAPEYLLTMNRFPGDGVTTVFNFVFTGGYLARSHVKAYVADAVTRVVLRPQIINDSDFLGPYQVRILPAVAANEILVIYRDTPKDEPLVDFTDGAILNESNLDKNARQAVFLAAEAFDRVSTAVVDSTAAAVAALAAAQRAEAAAIAAELIVDGINLQYLDWKNQYQGPKAVAPTLRPDGTALKQGDLYFDTTRQSLRVWGTQGWQSVIQGQLKRPAGNVPIIATAGQTAFTVPGGFDPGYGMIFLNGVSVAPPAINVSNGSNIVFAEPLVAGDEVDYVFFGAFDIANAIPAAGSVNNASVAAGAGIESTKLSHKNPGIGSVLRSLWSKLNEWVSLLDFGGDRNGFDTRDQMADATGWGMDARVPVLGAYELKLPRLGLKVWTTPNGIRERGCVASFEVAEYDAPEPETPITGLIGYQGVSEYPDRDNVTMYVGHVAIRCLLNTSATTFTANTVTSPDFAAVASKIKHGMLIDVATSPTKCSGTIIAFDATTNTITVGDGWYVAPSDHVLITPPNGTALKLAPNTKAWAINANTIIPEGADAVRGAVCEFGMIEYGPGGKIYGVDVVNLNPSVPNQAGFQARGPMFFGVDINEGKQYGVRSIAAAQANFYASGGEQGLQADACTTGVSIKAPANMAWQLLNGDNVFLTGVMPDGSQLLPKYGMATIAAGETAGPQKLITGPVVSSSAFACQLPAPGGVNALREIRVRNSPLSTANLVFEGPIDGGAGGVICAPGVVITLHSSGAAWIPVSKYTP